MSAWTNAYWPRSGDRGSTSTAQELAPDQRPQPRLELRLGSTPRHGREAGEREALPEDRRVLERAPGRPGRARRGGRRSARGASPGRRASPRSPTGSYAPSSRSTSRPSATSIRTVSTAYSGMPSARATIAATAGSGRPGHEPAEQLAHRRLGRAARGRAPVKLRLPAPQSGPALEELRPGERDDEDRDAAAPLEQVVDEVERARVGPVEVLEDQRRPVPSPASRSKNVRHAANSSSRAACRRLADAEQREQRAARSSARSSSSGTCSASDVARSARASSPRRRSRAGRRAPRTISPSAQNVMPSPYAGERPSCHQTVSTTPSTYFRNSQARRLLPMPAWPGDRDEPRRAARATVAWNRSLSRRSSSSRPTNGASRRLARPRPPRSATTRSARQAGTGASLPLSSCSPAGSKAIALARRPLGRLADEHGARAARRDWSRDAVLTRSPATMPWFVAPIVTAASPVRTPARAWMPGPERADGVDELERRPGPPLGVVLVRRPARPRRP